jgi:hypothetical protein
MIEGEVFVATKERDLHRDGMAFLVQNAETGASVTLSQGLERHLEKAPFG